MSEPSRDVPPLPTEALVESIAEQAPVSTGALARALETTPAEVRAALLPLEAQGLVYRTGRTRGTRWWLG